MHVHNKQNKKTLIVECLFNLCYLAVFSVSHFAAPKPMWVYFVEIEENLQISELSKQYK